MIHNTTGNELMTEDQFRKVLPPAMKGSINPKLIDSINIAMANPDYMDTFRENLLGFTSVINDGRFKLNNYIDAVKYVSFKFLGSTNVDAYVKTFPDRYQAMVDAGMNAKDISSRVNAYNNNKLVMLLFEQNMIPVWVSNRDLYQKALNTQAELMLYAKSEKVRSEAANSILTQLKPPETKKLELDISVNQNNAVEELKQTTLELVAQQKKMIEANATTATEVAHSKLLIDQEITDV